MDIVEHGSRTTRGTKGRDEKLSRMAGFWDSLREALSFTTAVLESRCSEVPARNKFEVGLDRSLRGDTSDGSLGDLDYCVGIHAEKFARVNKVRGMDADDFRQMLFIRLWKAGPRYDANLSSIDTYRERHLKWGCQDISRRTQIQRKAEKGWSSFDEICQVQRKAKKKQSSFDEIRQFERKAGDERSSFDEARFAHTGNPTSDLFNRLQDVLERLPKHLQQLAKLLQFGTPVQIAPRLGVSVSTVYRHIDDIRNHPDIKNLKRA